MPFIMVHVVDMYQARQSQPANSANPLILNDQLPPFTAARGVSPAFSTRCKARGRSISVRSAASGKDL